MGVTIQVAELKARTMDIVLGPAGTDMRSVWVLVAQNKLEASLALATIGEVNDIRSEGHPFILVDFDGPSKSSHSCEAKSTTNDSALKRRVSVASRPSRTSKPQGADGSKPAGDTGEVGDNDSVASFISL